MLTRIGVLWVRVSLDTVYFVLLWLTWCHVFLWKVKLSSLENLSGRKLTRCGLTACHIPETNAPWVFGQTGFPFFEVESTPVRTLGQGRRLSPRLCGGFSGWELSCCNICNHITSVPNCPHIVRFPWAAKLLVHWGLRNLCLLGNGRCFQTVKLKLLVDSFELERRIRCVAYKVTKWIR